tara:strand:- start:2377 stop:3492 length:1116 start_codon:yes stop_codon:yes gene_type:complete
MRLYNSKRLLCFILLFFILASLGSPTFHWDARSVWLYTAKLIFFDQGLFYLQQNYSPIHKAIAYPILGPTLAASFAEFIGYWNEVFPKFFSIILSIPGLIYLSFFIKNKISFFLYAFIIFFILEKSIIIGEMDGIVAVYFTVCVLISYQLFKKEIIFKNKNKKFDLFSERNIFYLFAILNFSFLSILKKEGVFYLIIAFLGVYITNLILSKNKKIYFDKILVFLISIGTFLLWEIYIYKYEVNLSNYPGVSILFDGGFFSHFFNRVSEIRNIFIISGHIFTTKAFIISIIIAVFLMTLNFSKIEKTNTHEMMILYLILIVFIFYTLFIFFIYTITSYDLLWHLKTSASRVMLPISFFISYWSLVNCQDNLN